MNHIKRRGGALKVKIESVTPGQYKSRGEVVRIVYGFYHTPFGDIVIAETAKGICSLRFAPERKKAFRDLKSQWKNADLIKGKGKQAPAVERFLNKHTVGKNKILLDLKGTDFQIKVWQALLKIPEGQLVSYGDVARMIGNPKAVRAVGTAVAKNRIAYIIPCHRVIRASGAIGQYFWGSDKKSMLIDWESAHLG